jgi:cysteine-rich repeat protein
MPGVCGDGIPQPGEQCDDGDEDDFDECHDDCTVPGETIWRTEIALRVTVT